MMPRLPMQRTSIVAAAAAAVILAGCSDDTTQATAEQSPPANNDQSTATRSGTGTTADAPMDKTARSQTESVLHYTIDSLEGEPVDLSQYRGNVVLLVNTASECGYTPQYKDLEALYQQYKDRGFVVLGFPANNFNGQEPGSDEQIAEFCERNFGVSFPMFTKVSVKGDDAHPLYKEIAGMPEPIGGEPRWNFTKFLLNKDGEVVQRYESAVSPTAQQVTARIDALLDS